MSRLVRKEDCTDGVCFGDKDIVGDLVRKCQALELENTELKLKVNQLDQLKSTHNKEKLEYERYKAQSDGRIRELENEVAMLKEAKKESS